MCIRDRTRGAARLLGAALNTYFGYRLIKLLLLQGPGRAVEGIFQNKKYKSIIYALCLYLLSYFIPLITGIFLTFFAGDLQMIENLNLFIPLLMLFVLVQHVLIFISETLMTLRFGSGEEFEMSMAKIYRFKRIGFMLMGFAIILKLLSDFGIKYKEQWAFYVTAHFLIVGSTAFISIFTMSFGNKLVKQMNAASQYISASKHPISENLRYFFIITSFSMIFQMTEIIICFVFRFDYKLYLLMEVLHFSPQQEEGLERVRFSWRVFGVELLTSVLLDCLAFHKSLQVVLIMYANDKEAEEVDIDPRLSQHLMGNNGTSLRASLRNSMTQRV
eukprot:TRINITY_DN3267_c0_g1_i10.p1 TRINITY_DN3267_c0_g1~~TRINITY_DN3267_c0_g1_i10.p1  ORF type:complete len:331 (-),score=71.50 TRINITY_DN3267_c0_g1_i10:162-1154(-)